MRPIAGVMLGRGHHRSAPRAVGSEGAVKAYETPLVEADQINIPDRKATAFELDVPLAELKPGFYTCQVNVIDDASGRFVFPRLALLVR